MNPQESLMIGTCPPGGLAGQFRHPHGRTGAWVGRLMALKNRTMNRLAVEALAPAPTDRILEIGCGPGTALAELGPLVPGGGIAGLDASPLMVQQAARRNAALVEERRLSLHVASAVALPFANDSFDRVLAVNAFHHWPDQERALTEVRRVLAPGGTLLLVHRAGGGGGRLRAPGLPPAEILALRDLLRWCGFRELEERRGRAGRRELVFLHARP